MEQLFVLLLCFYIPLCVLMALMALIGKDRKIGYGWGVVLCLFLSPIIGAIIILCSKERAVEFVDVNKGCRPQNQNSEAMHTVGVALLVLSILGIFVGLNGVISITEILVLILPVLLGICLIRLANEEEKKEEAKKKAWERSSKNNSGNN